MIFECLGHFATDLGWAEIHFWTLRIDRQETNANRYLCIIREFTPLYVYFISAHTFCIVSWGKTNYQKLYGGPKWYL